MKDKFVIEYMGQPQKMWVMGFHYNGKPVYTDQITQAMVCTEEAACIFTMEAADAGDPNYWASPMQVNISFGSL